MMKWETTFKSVESAVRAIRERVIMKKLPLNYGFIAVCSMVLDHEVNIATKRNQIYLKVSEKK